MEELVGIVNSIKFRNEQNGYTVLDLTDESENEITAVGALPLANVGERIKLVGRWVEHKVYGPQFSADSCETLAPADIEALIAYLGSGLIRGVGEATARNIVAMFGMGTLEMLENEPEKLRRVPGIGEQRAVMIYESYMAGRGMRDAMIALQGYGLTVPQAMKLYKLYGNYVLTKLRDNPYTLIDDVEGIGFVTADRIAAAAGIEPESALRIEAGIIYSLKLAVSRGHTYLPEDILVPFAAKTLGIDARPVEIELELLVIHGRVSIIDMGETNAVFMQYMLNYEKASAQKIINLKGRYKPDLFFDAETAIAELEKRDGPELAQLQREAIISALQEGVLIITGGPGTGKTTILKFVVKLMQQMGKSYEMCAPTGRAAKRMSEATGGEARTIHRMLEYGFGDENFTRGEDNPICTDFIIVDEMSMVDIVLFNALLKAIKLGTGIIMVGDADQLPPVGPGNALKDMIESGCIKTIKLSEIFRQSEHSAIAENAHIINNGGVPALDNKSDFFFESMESALQAQRRIVGVCSAKTKLLSGYDEFRDIQVLSPIKDGELGVKMLNKQLQAALNPPSRDKNEQSYGDIILREGDKVMQIKNNYGVEWSRRRHGGDIELGTGVFNGDFGTIMKIDKEAREVLILFDDERAANYDYSMLDEIMLAYCITIHKSQGSEFPVVVMPVFMRSKFTTRNLFYTAVTRAKNKVILIGRKESVEGMVANAEVSKRYSALRRFMEDYASI